MEKNILLDVRNLEVSFFSNGLWVKALNKITFSLGRGQVLGMVGESGSGKSVTALAIMGLLGGSPARIDGGSIQFNLGGQVTDLLALRARDWSGYRGKHMAMVFQEPMSSLNPVMRCGKQVMESLILHQKLSPKAAADRTIQLFGEVHLPRVHEMFKAWPHQLSGGQKQRVMIAMAMACRPALLIADEPTTALDVTVQKNILDLLKELQSRHGVSVLFITHDLAVVRQLANEVVVMHQGELVEAGPLSQVFQQPVHPYTRGLLACRPPLDSRPPVLPTLADFIEGKTIDFSSEAPEHRIAFHEQLYRGQALLQVEGLSVEFPVTKNWLGKTREVMRAVADINLEVYPGETLGLVGESGCGKTTLGRAILALQPASKGKISLQGQELTSLSNKQLRKLRRHFQIIFQDPYSSLNPRISVGSCLMEPMKTRGLAGTRKQRQHKAMALLEKVGLLPEHFYRYPHEFSGGQRQRICIARALALQPRFIVCDESVSALDISIQAQILNLLNDLKREFGFTYIFISHDLSVVRYMSDRIVVMKEGEIVESGEADQLFAKPRQDYTRRLIEAIP